MPRWNPIDLEGAEEMARAVAERQVSNPDVTMIRAYWTEFDTSVDVQREAFIYFLLHPLPVLTQQIPMKDGPPDDVRTELEGMGLQGVGEHWQIVTTLRNHHRGLNPRVNFMSATVSTEETTVYQEIYKQLD